MSSNKIFTPLAASNHSLETRAVHDFYATDPRAIDALIGVYPLPEVILEPCCGSGHLSKRLEAFGHTVISEDLYDHRYGNIGIDFMKRPAMPKGCGCIVSNFPYQEILQFTLHALDILPQGGILCSFSKTLFLESKARYDKLFSSQPPKYILQFINRIKCGKNGTFGSDSSAVSYAWFIWEKGWRGDPSIMWI